MSAIAFRKGSWRMEHNTGRNILKTALFRRTGPTSNTFLEIGVGDGGENNTTALLAAGGSGWWIEGSKKALQQDPG